MSGILGKITPTECQPTDEDHEHDDDDDDDDQVETEATLPSEKDDIEMLKKLANKHYYRYYNISLFDLIISLYKWMYYLPSLM